LADPEPEFGARGEHVARTYNGCLETEPAADPGTEALVKGSGCEAPLKLNAFSHHHNLRSRPICHKICILENKKFVRRLGRAWSLWIRQWLWFRDNYLQLVFAVHCRSGSLQLLCEGLKLVRAASPESVGVQVFYQLYTTHCNINKQYDHL